MFPPCSMPRPRAQPPSPDPRRSPRPELCAPVAPAMVGLRVRCRPTAFRGTLGVERGGSGVIDSGRHVHHRQLRGAGRRGESTLTLRRRAQGAGKAFTPSIWSPGSGGQARGTGPWPEPPSGDSSKRLRGRSHGHYRIDEDARPRGRPEPVQAIRPFAASWEVHLDRAFLVAPP